MGLQVGGHMVLPARGGDNSGLTDTVGTRALKALSSQTQVFTSTRVGASGDTSQEPTRSTESLASRLSISAH